MGCGERVVRLLQLISRLLLACQARFARFQIGGELPTSLPLRLQGIRNKQALDQVVEQSLRDAALWNEVKDRLDQNALSLSGGQQQRLCIARALAVKPSILLMDEPCSALDPIATARVEELVNKLKQDYTIILVTHNMQQAARISDYTAFFYLGKIVEYDHTDSIFMNPANPKTEAYISGRFG